LSHPSYCGKCGTSLEDGVQFCPKCGREVTTLPPDTGVRSPISPQASTSSPTQPKQIIKGIDNRLLILGLVVLFLIVPVFPRERIVYVDGSTQTVVNSTTLSTSVVMNTQATVSQVSVYTGSFQYFSGNQYYNNYYNNWYNNCFWMNGHIRCNYNMWNWYQPSYGTTVTVTPSMNVVNVIRTQQGSSESLTLVYYNGQQSQTYQNVYVDNLAQSGVSSLPATTVVTNTIVNTIVNPVTQTVSCQQCIPTTVTDHVSILQMLLGY